MSVYVSSLIWRHFPDGGGAMLTALALADIADDQGRCVYDDASAAAIAQKTQQGPRAVGYHFAAMRRSGWLEVTENQTGGRGNKIKIRIPVERIPRTATERLQKLQALPETVMSLDGPAQPVVDRSPKSLQKMQACEKGATSDTNPANSDTKGCKTEHPSNVGYVVHKKHVGSQATAIPEDFVLSDSLKAWAAKKGFDSRYLQEHFDWFLDYARARPTKVRYADWDAAFRNCVTSDWGGVRRNWKPRPLQQQDTGCTESMGRGELCGMTPSEVFGSGRLCAHHRTKIMNSGPMPKAVREQLDGMLKRKRAPA